MKAILFSILLTLCTLGTTAQIKKGTGVATLDVTKPKNKRLLTTPQKTGAVKTYQNSCYTNFDFTLQNYGYNKGGKFYSWGVKVKNNYTQAVQLRYKLIVGGANVNITTLTYYIKPGETYDNDFGKISAIIVDNNSTNYEIEISEVCFEGMDCFKNGYVDCSGNQKNANTKKTEIAKKQEEPVPVYSGPTYAFEKTKSYEQSREVLKSFLVNNGFHFIKFDGLSKYYFEEFTFSYVPHFGAPYYIEYLTIDDVKDKNLLQKLYSMFGCPNKSGTGCECSIYNDDFTIHVK